MKSIILTLTLLLSLDSFGQLIDGDNLKRQKYYDSTLNKIRLRDPRTVEKVFERTDNLIENDEETEVTNENGSQLLTMIFHPGDVINSFSEFKVEYNSQTKRTGLRIKEKEFVTGKGIKLGTTEKQLIHALGQPKDKKTDKDFLIYVYQQEGGLYFGNYYFKNGRLERFWFGEEYP